MACIDSIILQVSDALDNFDKAYTEGLAEEEERLQVLNLTSTALGHAAAPPRELNASAGCTVSRALRARV